MFNKLITYRWQIYEKSICQQYYLYLFSKLASDFSTISINGEHKLGLTASTGTTNKT